MLRSKNGTRDTFCTSCRLLLLFLEKFSVFCHSKRGNCSLVQYRVKKSQYGSKAPKNKHHQAAGRESSPSFVKAHERKEQKYVSCGTQFGLSVLHGTHTHSELSSYGWSCSNDKKGSPSFYGLLEQQGI